jgi:maleate isomerase
MWQPDGVGSLARIGILVPHFDPVPETEFKTLAPEGISIHTARVLLGTLDNEGNTAFQRGPAAARAFAEPPQVDNAALLLASIPVDVIAYAYTGSSYICGPDGDAALKARLQAHVRGIPVVIPAEAFRLALRALGVRRITLIHPPWFSADLDEAGAAYFQRHGFDVAYHASARLRSDFGEVSPEQIYDWARGHVPASTDALVIAGNGMRAIGAIEALEQTLGVPVLSANQVAFWHALRLVGLHAPLRHYGCIFAASLPPVHEGECFPDLTLRIAKAAP